MSAARKICVVTGSRAEYGILKTVLRAVRKEARLALQVVAAGMHLAEEFGATEREIAADGFPIDARVAMLPENDSQRAMAAAVGAGIRGFADAFASLQPQIVVILGDRIEALAAAIAAAYGGIAVAHIHGGDRTRGGLDESARHAITKFAHLHFPATAASAARIKALGEDDWRIHVAGAPGLDAILEQQLPDRATLERALGDSLAPPVVLLVQHSVTTQVTAARAQITTTLEALRPLAVRTIAVYPNSDSGGREIAKVLEEYAAREPWLKLHRSIAHPQYLGLLRAVSALVGNSSSAIIEAPALGLPAVDIGDRQRGRERATNVISVPHEEGVIRAAVARSITAEYRARLAGIASPYGDGRAGVRIAAALATVELSPRLFEKQIAY
ncbi:MAG: UDP-N-acetylglucosamine 2-epimerase [Planctomycetes bacterium]|nr:UDP-N-acetylglucosamine 2-epimerase [Planctomycetota bacterium]